jgi:hypothetical protein
VATIHIQGHLGTVLKQIQNGKGSAIFSFLLTPEKHVLANVELSVISWRHSRAQKPLCTLMIHNPRVFSSRSSQTVERSEFG